MAACCWGRPQARAREVAQPCVLEVPPVQDRAGGTGAPRHLALFESFAACRLSEPEGLRLGCAFGILTPRCRITQLAEDRAGNIADSPLRRTDHGLLHLFLVSVCEQARTRILT